MKDFNNYKILLFNCYQRFIIIFEESSDSNRFNFHLFIPLNLLSI